MPKRFDAVDDRGVIRVSLRTKSLETARMRRDAMAEADDLFWASLAAPANDDLSQAAEAAMRQVAVNRYRRASARAMARGFVYSPAADLAEALEVAEVVTRVREVDRHDKGSKSAGEQIEAEALLGGVAAPKVSITEAFEIYCSDIAVTELLKKSENQKRTWRKTKLRAINYFVEVVDDMPMVDISREDALKFYNWWKDRIMAKQGEKRRGANTANRDLGNLRKLYGEYFKHVGEEERLNPFRNLNFRERDAVKEKKTPSFEDDWVSKKILVPGVLDGINKQAKIIAYALIETGCRPSEIANLDPRKDICLDHAVPHIRIRPHENMEKKTASSVREIPLVGVSLEAMKHARDGFPHYYDRNDLLSASLNKAFRNRGLMPSKEHVIYSFRHSFEKRMQEAGLDYALRCLLMGHATDRPAYGDGGSLEYRRDELLKIVHAFPEGLF